MTREEIIHLSSLARIRLTEDEITAFMSDIDAILEYVSQMNELVAPADLTKRVGAVHNVFREDVVTNEPGAYTEVVVAGMPAKQDNYLKVKKILQTDT